MTIKEIKETVNTYRLGAKEYIAEHKPQIKTAVKTALIVGIPMYLKGYLFGYRDGMTWMKVHDVQTKTINEYVEEYNDETE